MVAYLFVGAMVLTSFDRMARVMRHAAWRCFHVWGSHVIWFTFFVAHWRRAAGYRLFDGPFLMASAGALLVRVTAKAQPKHGIRRQHSTNMEDAQ